MSPMTQAKWDAMSAAEKNKVRDLSGLTKQLIGLEGCRVEVIEHYHYDGDWPKQKHRFWVGRSSGWRPCHIELKLITSRSGPSCSSSYAEVRVIKSQRRRGSLVPLS